MKRAYIRLWVVGLVINLSVPLASAAVRVSAQATEASLFVSSFKVTSSSGQFVELHNSGTEPIDMGQVQLAYYNHYDVQKATSSKLVSLSGTLPAGGYYLVNDSTMNLCYQTMAASASLSFSSTAGLVQVHRLQQSTAGGSISSTVIDSVAWSKTATPYAQTLPANANTFLLRQWAEQEAPHASGGTWLSVQPSIDDPCVYESILTADPTDQDFTLLPGSLPPIRYVAAPATGAAVNRNIGMMAPVINELLPNPASPQTDAADEFIELYNPNTTSFDLTGFKLAFGSTNPRSYSFPEGTVLPPGSFTAFTSADTSISLSNSEAQTWLLDPAGQIVSQSEPYRDADDGQAWVLENGTWRWTAVPTPNELNAITQEAGASQERTAAVLGISDTSGGLGTATANQSNPAGGAPTQDDAAPLHPAVLAGVGMLAVGYGLYEYRHDLGNRIFQLRRYLRLRRALR